MEEGRWKMEERKKEAGRWKIKDGRGERSDLNKREATLWRRGSGM